MPRSGAGPDSVGRPAVAFAGPCTAGAAGRGPPAPARAPRPAAPSVSAQPRVPTSAPLSRLLPPPQPLCLPCRPQSRSCSLPSKSRRAKLHGPAPAHPQPPRRIPGRPGARPTGRPPSSPGSAPAGGRVPTRRRGENGPSPVRHQTEGTPGPAPWGPGRQSGAGPPGPSHPGATRRTATLDRACSRGRGGRTGCGAPRQAPGPGTHAAGPRLRASPPRAPGRRAPQGPRARRRRGVAAARLRGGPPEGGLPADRVALGRHSRRRAGFTSLVLLLPPTPPPRLPPRPIGAGARPAAAGLGAPPVPPGPARHVTKFFELRGGWAVQVSCGGGGGLQQRHWFAASATSAGPTGVTVGSDGNVTGPPGRGTGVGQRASRRRNRRPGGGRGVRRAHVTGDAGRDDKAGHARPEAAVLRWREGREREVLHLLWITLHKYHTLEGVGSLRPGLGPVRPGGNGGRILSPGCKSHPGPRGRLFFSS